MSWKTSYTPEELEMIKEASTQAKNKAQEIKNRREQGIQMNYGKRDSGGSGANRTQQFNKLPMLGYDKFNGKNQLTPTIPTNIDGQRNFPIANQAQRNMVASQVNGQRNFPIANQAQRNMVASQVNGAGARSARNRVISIPSIDVNTSTHAMNGGSNPYEKNFSGLGMAGLAGTAGLMGLGLGGYSLYNHFANGGELPSGTEHQFGDTGDYPKYLNPFGDTGDYSKYLNPAGVVPGSQFDDAMKRIKEKAELMNSGKGADAFNAAMNGDSVDAFNRNMGITNSDIRKTYETVQQNPALFAGAGAAAGLGAGMLASRRRNA